MIVNLFGRNLNWGKNGTQPMFLIIGKLINLPCLCKIDHEKNPVMFGLYYFFGSSNLNLHFCIKAAVKIMHGTMSF